ncbi:Conserved hypothetical protein [Prochlorococcus marinus str. MIT 9303]|uniref:Uncharacterized protein n=1 Tax=Prochlorococcus marinus (strain MIT 9303) TaxID=59922 RepID=A2C7K2_PROM3|nr:Conserved hypothetical protein [Prochlorococcus marinus str. MIT 9303]
MLNPRQEENLNNSLINSALNSEAIKTTAHSLVVFAVLN